MMAGSLSQAIQEYFTAAWEQFSGMEKPTRMWLTPSSLGIRSSGTSGKERIDYWKAARRIAERLHTEPQFQFLIETIASDESLAGSYAAAKAEEYWGGPGSHPVRRSTRRAHEFIDGLVMIPLVEFLERGEAYGYPSEAASGVLAQFAADLTARGVIVRRTVPLTNLRVTGGPYKLAEGVFVREPDRKDFENWLNGDEVAQFGAVPLPGHLEVLRVAAVADITTEVDTGSIAALRDKTDAIMNQLLATLRLATGKHIDAPFWEERVSAMPTVIRPVMIRPIPLRGMEEATLADTSAQDAKALWPKLDGYPEIRVAGLAVRRFNDAATRVRADDRLIGYWIALESLFAPDSNVEVKFRASYRIGAYVGDTPEERIDIYNAMRSSYDCRSDLVHGSANKKAKQPVEAVSERTGDILQRALLKVLADADFNAIAIDAKLLKGEMPGGAR